MGHIFFLMGKSACGKDTLYSQLLTLEKDIKRVVPYTTRPVRQGETDGEQYFFTSIQKLNELTRDGLIIEQRVYHTVHGDWHYFTVNDGQINLEKDDYLVIGTLESYVSFSKYFGKDKVVPLYIEIDDGVRLERALSRERSQLQPKYEEMCRRFLADAQDFSEENLIKAGVSERYENKDLSECLERLRKKIWTLRSTS